MSTIFVSGSRQIRHLAEPFRLRLANIVNAGHPVVVGDADGADAAVQAWFREQGYDRLTIFHSGQVPRNNLGRWTVKRVAVPAGMSGFAFHAMKDRAMADMADYGLMIWDGLSPGTILNALRLIQSGKISVLFDGARETTVTIRSAADWRGLVASRPPAVQAAIRQRATPGEWAVVP